MIPYLLGAAALLGLLVLPGLAIAVVAVTTGPAEPPRRRLALYWLAGGLTFWFLAGEVLVRAGALSTPVVWTFTLAVAVVSIVVVRRSGAAVRGLVARDARPSLAIGGLATLVASFPVLRVLSARRDALVSSTPWYYWRLVQETVRAGGVPRFSHEWALRLPFLDDYSGFTSAASVLAVATGSPGDLAAAHLMTTVAVLTVGMATYLLARELGADRVPAGMAVVLMTAGATLSTKLVSFRPEAAGYALMLLIPALAQDYFRTRDVASLVLCAATSLALSQVHGLDWVFAVAMTGGVVMGCAVLGWPRRSGTFRAVVVFGVVVTGAWFGGNAVLGGGLSGAGKLSGLPQIVAGRDPTHEFRSLVAGSAIPGSAPTLAGMARDSLTPGMAGGGDGWWTIGAVVTLTALVYASTQRGAPRRRTFPIVVIVVVTLLVVTAFSMWLAVTHSTFVPRRTGFNRVLQLGVVLFPITLAVVLTVIGYRRRVFATVLSIAVAAVAFIPSLGPIQESVTRMPMRATLTSLRALELGPHALVLTNFYSEGFVPDVLDAAGALDGRAPYTEAKTLATVNDALLRSLQFFATPGAPGVGLPVAGVTHVLVATGPAWSVGAGTRFVTDIAALDARGDLRLVASEPEYRLYEVVR